MPISISTFASILADLQTSFRTSIPRAVLYPLAVVVTVLVLIWGYAHGWKPLDEFWKNTTDFEKGIVGAAAVLVSEARNANAIAQISITGYRRHALRSSLRPATGSGPSSLINPALPFLFL